jgi:ACT domain-containing protein
MKAIVSVFAKDAKGIIAYITAFLAEQEINILDISQTLMHEYFTMMMLVDLTDCPLAFDVLAQQLKEKGEARDLSVNIQRQDIFDSMHRI